MPSLVKSRAGKRAARRAGEAGKRTEYLAFVLAGETYAVRIAQLAEILRPPPITEVPRAPKTVLGVISVRGKLVTVLDLRRRLRLPEAPVDRRSRILLVEFGAEQLGLLVDEVQQVWRLALEEIEPAMVPRQRSGRSHRGHRPAHGRRWDHADPAGSPAAGGGRLRHGKARDQAPPPARPFEEPRRLHRGRRPLRRGDRAREGDRERARSGAAPALAPGGNRGGGLPRRGHVPVIDLRTRFGLPAADRTRANRSGSSSTSPGAPRPSSSTRSPTSSAQAARSSGPRRSSAAATTSAASRA